MMKRLLLVMFGFCLLLLIAAEGVLPPDPAFAALLGLDGDHLFLQSFGLPTAAGIAYPAEVQDSTNLDSLDNLVSFITLPDGGVIRFSQGLMTSLWHCVTEGCTLAQP